MPKHHPPQAEWIALPAAEIAAQVDPHGLSAFVGLDATRRWAYLHDPATRTDFERYAEITCRATTELVERFFTLGVRAVILPSIHPKHAGRGEAWFRMGVEQGLSRFLRPEALEVFARWNARVRLGGTFRASKSWAADMLEEINQRFTEATPTGERLLLWQCNTEDEFEASLRVSAQVGPSSADVRRVFYPDGPERIHLAVITGRLYAFSRPFLGGADIYLMNNFALDIEDAQIRAILYDHLFQREVAAQADPDGRPYSDELLEDIRAWYYQKESRVIGLGELGPGGIWWPRGGVEPRELT